MAKRRRNQLHHPPIGTFSATQRPSIRARHPGTCRLCGLAIHVDQHITPVAGGWRHTHIGECRNARPAHHQATIDQRRPTPQDLQSNTPPG